MPGLLERVLNDKGYKEFINSEFFKLLCLVAMAHQEWPWEEKYKEIEEIAPQVELNKNTPFDPKRTCGIAALIAVCDLFDDGPQRCNTIELILHRHGTPLNKAHWIRHLLIMSPIEIKKNKFSVYLKRLEYKEDSRGKHLGTDPSGCGDKTRFKQVINGLKNQYSSALLYNCALKEIGAELLEPEYNENNESICYVPWNLYELKEFWGCAPERLLQSLFTFAKEPNERIKEEWKNIKVKAEFKKIDMQKYYDFIGIRNENKEPLLEEEIAFKSILKVKDINPEILSKEANRYLRDEAIKAHLDGSGAKARHLAALALREVTTIKESVFRTLKLRDLFWAFSLLTYWMIDDQDYSSVLYPALRKFEKNRKKEKANEGCNYKSIKHEGIKDNSEDWLILAQFLILTLRPDFGSLDNNINLLEGIKEDFLCQELENLELVVFSFTLSFIIELIFIFQPGILTGNPEDAKWKKLSLKWESYTKVKKNNVIFSSLSNTRKRLERQYKCCISYDGNIDKSENPLEEYWRAFYDFEFEKMKKLLDEIIKTSDRDKDNFYMVQALTNMSRWPLLIYGNQTFKDQATGIYRIQRLYMENLRLLINKLRKIKFEEILANVRSEAEEKSIVHDIFNHLLRLSYLTEITAFQNWDFDSYLEALRMRSKGYLFLGLYPLDFEKKTPSDCDPKLLEASIYFGVKGISLQKDNSLFYKDIKRAVLTLELCNDGKEYIESFLDLLIKSIRPLEYIGIMRTFSILSDAIPERYFSDIFKIYIAAIELQKENFDFKLLGWWEAIFRWRDIKESHWHLIDSILSNHSIMPYVLKKDYEMLIEALKKAPTDIYKKWAQGILDAPEYFLKYGYYVLSHAAFEREEIRESAIIAIERMNDNKGLNETEAAYIKEILQSQESKELCTSDEAERYRSHVLDSFIKYCQSVSVSERESRPEGILPSRKQPIVDKFRSETWINLDKTKWDELNNSARNAMLNPYISVREFNSIIMIWTTICFQQSKEIINNCAEWLFENYKSGKFGLSISKNSIKVNPISDIASPELITKGVKLSISSFLPHVSSNLSEDLLSFTEESIPETDEGYLPSIWAILFEFYIFGDRKYSLQAINAVKAVYIRIAGNTDLLSECIERFYNLMVYVDDKTGKRTVDLLKDLDYKPILDLIDKILEKLIKAPNPDARRSSALVISLLKNMGWTNDKRENWLERLKDDPRARVFKAFIGM